MAYLDDYYRAYRSFQDQVSPLEIHKMRMEAMRDSDMGIDVQNSSTSVRIIDMEWVEAIEKCIAPMDIVIRENRRFIRTDEEVVPIEKSRRITTESVRHLAQHTNMIARVEGDEVTPESILNIRHEESFAIYENRFLVLVIDTVLLFLEKRYAALTAAADSNLSHVCMSREFTNDREHTRFTLDYFSEFEDKKEYNIDDDVAALSDFQRVSRVRKIFSTFAASPLIRSLKGVQPVRPPITRTNLLTKNPNYRACLELYLYLESYNKPGFDTVQEEVRGVMEQDIKEDLESAMDMVHFIVRTRTNPQLCENLQKNFDEENERIAAEEKRQKEEREKHAQLRLTTAVENERKAQEEKLRQFMEENARKLEELAAEAQKRLEEQKKDFDAFVADLKARYEKRLADRKEEYEFKLSTQKADYEQKIAQQRAEYLAQLDALKTDYKAKLTAQKADFVGQLTAQKADYESQLASQKDSYEAQLAAQKADYESQLAAQKDSYEAQLASQKDSYESRIAALLAEAAETLRQHDEAHAAELKAIQEAHAAELTRRQTAFDAALADEKAAHEADRKAAEEKLARTQADHETRVRTMEESHASAKASITEELRTQKDKVRTLTEQLRAAEKKAAQLESQLAAEQKRAEHAEAQIAKTESACEKKLENMAQNYKTKLERMEKRAQRRNDRLQRQLDRALKKYPVTESADDESVDAED